jgi:hypothetical protein
VIVPRVTFDPTPYVRISRAAKVLPERFLQNLRRKLPDLKDKILTVTAVIPGPVQYPIRWKSERQRKAFFATDGFGRGIPTGRVQEPGGVLGGYDVTLVATPDGGQFDLTNAYPGAVFIVGEFQQPFHEFTGWLPVDDAMPQNRIFAVDTVFDTWDETVREVT